MQCLSRKEDRECKTLSVLFLSVRVYCSTADTLFGVLLGWWEIGDFSHGQARLGEFRNSSPNCYSVAFASFRSQAAPIHSSLPTILQCKIKSTPFGVLLGWWTRWGSNPWPLRCERSALPAELRALVNRLRKKAEPMIFFEI